MSLQRGNPNNCLGLPQELFHDVLRASIQNWPTNAPFNKFSLAKVNRSFYHVSFPLLNTEWTFKNGTMDSLLSYLETRLQNHHLSDHLKSIKIDWVRMVYPEAATDRLTYDFDYRFRKLIQSVTTDQTLQSHLQVTLDHFHSRRPSVDGEQGLLLAILALLPTTVTSLQFECAPLRPGSLLTLYKDPTLTHPPTDLIIGDHFTEITLSPEATTYHTLGRHGKLDETVLYDLFGSRSLKKLNTFCVASGPHPGPASLANNVLEELVHVDSQNWTEMPAWLCHFSNLKVLAIHRCSSSFGFEIRNRHNVALRQHAATLEILHLHNKHGGPLESLRSFKKLTAISISLRSFGGLFTPFDTFAPLFSLLPLKLTSLRVYITKSELQNDGGLTYLTEYIKACAANIKRTGPLKEIIVVIEEFTVLAWRTIDEALLVTQKEALTATASAANIKLTWHELDGSIAGVEALPDFAGKAWGFEHGLIEPFYGVIERAGPFDRRTL